MKFHISIRKELTVNFIVEAESKSKALLKIHEPCVLRGTLLDNAPDKSEIDKLSEIGVGVGEFAIERITVSDEDEMPQARTLRRLPIHSVHERKIALKLIKEMNDK